MFTFIDKKYILLLVSILFITASCSDNDEKTDKEPEEYETNMPYLSINTVGGQAIDQKENYILADIRIVEDPSAKTDKNIIEEGIYIRGRGNSTWTLFPKKPYKFKFDNKISLFGEVAHKHWVLLANYGDKTKIRNNTTFYMGHISNLAWTPHSHFVEVILNNRFIGLYELCEQVKTGKGRVDISKTGYLVEIDQKSKMLDSDIYFETKHREPSITGSDFIFEVKEPSIEQNPLELAWIKDYVEGMEDVLYGSEFKDEQHGYRKYIDVPSFVDWYLINEIVKNTDSRFYSSCFFHVEKGGKLIMGPLWDFDLSFGNASHEGGEDPTGFYTSQAKWFDRLLQDPYFVGEVKKRFTYFKSRKQDILRHMDETVERLSAAVEKDNKEWDYMDKVVWPSDKNRGSYKDEVNYARDFLNKRFEWLDKAFSEL